MISAWDSLTYVILYTLLMWMPYMLAQFYSNGTAKLLFTDGMFKKMSCARLRFPSPNPRVPSPDVR